MSFPIALLRRLHPSALFAVAAALSLAALCLGCRGSGVASSGPMPPLSPNSPQFYTQEVKPIFVAHCYKCHGGMTHKGDLILGSRAGILRGGKDGAILVPGHPEQSLIIRLIRQEDPQGHPKPMPPKGKLSDADIATITRWIQAGALLPPDPSQ